MENRIDAQLKKIKDEKRLGVMTHVIVGYPTLRDTVSIVQTMAEEGVDFVELQIPFSDPLADGPTIMEACEEALRGGTRVKHAFTVARELSQKVKIPLLFMAYYNTVFKYGVAKFARDAKEAGISGLIIPDMPLEEEVNECLGHAAEANKLHLIRVISPVSHAERLRKNAAVASGFVYCSARQGITGARKELDKNIGAYLRLVRKHIKLPLAVGFGISKREHLELLRKHADIAVIGSALITVVKNAQQGDAPGAVRTFLKQLGV